jgi:hypothetical protein
MKKTYTVLLFLLATVSILAQAPEKMSYQAVLRDASNTLLTNQSVGVEISILQGTITGASVYTETQTVTTNLNGLVSLEIGTGSTSDSFATIDWSAGPYFIKTATDPSGGSSYSITGTSQIMSVPFAMYAKTSGSSMPGPQGAIGIQGAQGDTGAKGVDGADGTNGAKGDQGIQGAIGATGASGTQGVQGETGTAGADGAAGMNGTNGDQGAQGIQGATGSAGTDGTNGIQGAQGAIGTAGAAGAAGTDGTNGIQGTQGAIGAVGADGAAGTNGTNGDQGIQGETGSVGTNGERGVTGNQGARGIQGETGTAGADGANGSNGSNGAKGDQGIQGETGSAGTNGTNGIPGIQGEPGATGADGTNGTNGDNGDQGASGIQGETGTAGSQGTQGETGITGSAGENGANGNTWTSNILNPSSAYPGVVVGDQWLNTTSGDVFEWDGFNWNGTGNIQGTNGSVGATGATGAQGDMGATGAQGIQGETGAQGEIGATGPSGATGNTGNTGVGIAQTLSFTSPNLVLSDNGGSIDLTGLINDADSDNSNEIQNLSQVLTQGNSAGVQLKDVTDPTNAQDATTKAYVDALIEALEARIIALEPPPAIGDLRDGGVVFWVDGNGGGLVCAYQDYPIQVEWGCYNVDLPSVPNVTSNPPVGPGAEIGDGEDNTTGILADCSSSPAALAARSYGPEWFLPSINELNEIEINRATLEAVPGFSAFGNYYWSSTEYDYSFAWLQYFTNGIQDGFDKLNTSLSVRAVRAF